MHAPTLISDVMLIAPGGSRQHGQNVVIENRQQDHFRSRQRFCLCWPKYFRKWWLESCVDQWRMKDCKESTDREPTCLGSDIEVADCACEWTIWQSWGACSIKSGVMERIKLCEGHKGCVSQNEDENTELGRCDVNGSCGEWSSWSYCSLKRHSERQRFCNNPDPQHQGRK